VRPDALLRRRREVLLLMWRRLQERARHQLERHQNQADSIAIRLRLLGPDQVLQRGYSITSDAETGKVLRGANEVRTGQRLRTRLKTGEVVSRVEKAT
jgi:exodeoxyribonuclease VII large subunit